MGLPGVGTTLTVVLLEDLLAVEAGQHDVQEDHLDGPFGGQAHALLAVRGRQGAVAVGGQAALQKPHYGGVILHYQYLHKPASIIQRRLEP